MRRGATNIMTEIDEEVVEIMENNNLDEDTAERVVDIMNELGVDEEDAVELEEMEI